MPPIRSCGPITDGVEILTSLAALGVAGRISLTRNTIPANVRNKTAPEIEAWANNWLDQQLGQEMTDPTDPMFGKTWYPFRATVSVQSVNPLVATVTCTTGGWV